MKAHLRQIILGLGVIGAMTLYPTAARADLEVTASVNIRATTEFHAPLAPYGTWIEVGSYGRCWRPSQIAVGWRPYCEGSWVSTDAGWYWETEEPWGWACYHYGTWYEAPDYGWVWVPGIEWAPAWVSWRFGGGYCGWSPLSPAGVVVAPAAFVFVETRRFHEPIRRSRVIVNNTTIINNTTVIGGPVRANRNISGQREQSVFVNKGPDVGEVSRATGKRSAPTPIREVARRADPPEPVVRQIKQEQTRGTETGGRDRDRQNPNRRDPNRRDAANPTSDPNQVPVRTPNPTPKPAPTPAPTPAPAPTPTPRTNPDLKPTTPAPAPVPTPNRPQRQPGPPERQQNRPVTPPPVERPPQPVTPRENARDRDRPVGNERVAPAVPAPAPAPVPPQPPQREKGPPQERGKGHEKDKDRDN